MDLKKNNQTILEDSFERHMFSKTGKQSEWRFWKNHRLKDVESVEKKVWKIWKIKRRLWKKQINKRQFWKKDSLKDRHFVRQKKRGLKEWQFLKERQSTKDRGRATGRSSPVLLTLPCLVGQQVASPPLSLEGTPGALPSGVTFCAPGNNKGAHDWNGNGNARWKTSLEFRIHEERPFTFFYLSVPETGKMEDGNVYFLWS